MALKNRIELTRYLAEVMSNTYDKLRKEGELEFGQNLLKTYIIESNTSPQKIRNSLDYAGYTTSIQETEEKTLFTLQVANKKNIDKKEQKPINFYLDAFDPRFWLLHTTGKSTTTDAIIKRTINMLANGLDHPWFTRTFLEQTAEKSIFRGLSIRYDDIFIRDEESPIKQLSMKLWGTAASEVLQTLKNNPKLSHSISISGVGIRRSYDDNFVIDDINYWGKFTAKGTSIDGHLQILSELKSKYSATLHFIEEEFCIERTFTGAGYSFKGHPMTITLSKDIENLEGFTDELTSSKKPFRIWGIKNILDKDFIKVVGIDLHHKDKLGLEITPNWIRVYLDKGACGNTVMRLLTYIQQYYDSEAKLEEIEGIGNG